ncbi:uncharacterized protein F4812DRAFT_411644 [Daldinia caldariorum]|uniref:uncharacterized protein n=1 Tax=Daldinia caldariorum TaxID=326644 RepID=UPI0020077420|nr:uncharacterized protein F4812DRAFT_411644 [Daldinia caldariorum]KAI1473112.1 hypothetical protein F4812DRAFT_411644 [Daldinia caldariorum]
MDWPNVDTCFDNNDFGNFKYLSSPFKITRKLRSDKELVCWNIKSSEDLREWIEKNQSSIHGSCEHGTFAVIFSRNSSLDFSTPSYLPISKPEFSQLIELFRIHRSIVRTIRREITYFSRTHLNHGAVGCNNIVYTARTSSEWSDDVALSSTYLSHRKLNLSVFYGCNDEQSFDIERRLSNAGDAIYHPVLTPGILIELDRKRLVERVDSVLDPFVSFMSSAEALCCTTRDPESILNRDGETTDDLLCLYNSASELTKGIRKIKRQISDMCKHIDELETTYTDIKRKRSLYRRSGLKKKDGVKLHPPFIASNINTRIRERLSEIEAEYDEKLDECHMVLDGLNFATQMASGHVARHQTFTNTRISIETKRDNAQMRSIAIVTMIYLPLTSVASIFSMGVFNWGATESQPILTFYFWVYVAIGGGLTVITLALWWVLTRRSSSVKGHHEATEMAVMV